VSLECKFDDIIPVVQSNIRLYKFIVYLTVKLVLLSESVLL